MARRRGLGAAAGAGSGATGVLDQPFTKAVGDHRVVGAPWTVTLGRLDTKKPPWPR